MQPTVAEQCGNMSIFKSGEVTARQRRLRSAGWPGDLQSRGLWGLSCLGYQPLGRPAITLSQPKEQSRLQIQRLMISLSEYSLVSEWLAPLHVFFSSFFFYFYHNYFFYYLPLHSVNLKSIFLTHSLHCSVTLWPCVFNFSVTVIVSPSSTNTCGHQLTQNLRWS